MGLISLDQLNTDMVLASDVKDLSGRLLAVKGAKLTEAHLRIFRMWGVIEADIEGVPSKDAEEDALVNLNPDLLTTAEEIVRPRFAHSDCEQQANQKLFQLCTLRMAERLDREKPDLPLGKCDHRNEELQSYSTCARADHRIDPVVFVKEEVSLPVLPGIALEMMETLKNPNSSSKQIANVIGKDVSLSAKILRFVNSSFYGFPSRIDTLSRAVLVLGTNQLSTLATGMKLLTFFQNIPSKLVDMKSFVDHSVTCGILARIIGAYKNIPNTERLFLSGLLHDIGRLVLYSHLPLAAKEALVVAGRNQDLLYRAEAKVFGCDHAKVGGLLLKRWKLPVSLEAAVRHHHDPQEYMDPLEASIVHLADIIANAVERGSSGERFVPPLSAAAWECIGLSARILPTVIEKMEVHREAVLPHLLNGS